MIKKSSNEFQDTRLYDNSDFLDNYSATGESEYSRASTIPFDQDEVLSERHYTFGSLENIARKVSRSRLVGHNNLVNFRGRGPKGFRRSDETIKEDVCEALYRASEVDASEIEVFVKNGIVTLKGFVKDRAQKIKAEETIENLAGIDDIFNDLSLKANDQNKQKIGKFGLTDNITGLN